MSWHSNEKHPVLKMITLIIFAAMSYLLMATPCVLADKYQPMQDPGKTIAENKQLLTAAEVLALKEQNHLAILVDVRSEKEFQKIRIPESINIPLPFVRTKSYLHGMKVVLLDEGYNLKGLLLEAKSLEESGFDISILAGGLAAWHQNGGKFEGGLFNLPVLHLTPAHSLLPGNRSSIFHTFIDISPEQDFEIENDFSNLFHFPIQTKEDIPQLISFIEKQNIDPHSAVLILNNDGKYEPVSSLPELCTTTTFFLKGGLRAYQQAVVQHKAMTQDREQRLKTVGGCPTCPPASKEKEAQQ